METNTAKMARTDQRELPSPAIDEDRLSSLPDGIISHILSFLPTKYAVGTAVLSRRWKDLWNMVSNLDFDNSLVYKKLPCLEDVHSVPPEERKEMKATRRREFSRFVDRVLTQHRNLDSLRRFRLHFAVPERAFGSWDYEEAVGYLADYFSAHKRYGDGVVPPWMCGRTLPESFYTWKNVQVVKLCGVVMAENWSVSLPSLKILELCRVTIEDLEKLSRLISGCPVLETLCLEYCTSLVRKEEDVLTASMPSLKYLSIRYDKCLCRVIVIEAPKLEHVYLENFVEVQFVGSSSSPLPCLQSARVDASDRASLYHCLIRLLTQISNAKELYLCTCTLDFLSAGDDVQRLVFPNLTRLTVEPPAESCTRRILHSLLHSASKLQSLVINMWTAKDSVMWEEIETEPTGTPKCLLSSLEEIEIKGLETFESEVKMVGYLLSVGAVLKKVDIDLVSADTKRERKELRSLLELPRESTACDVRLTLGDGEIDINIDVDDEINTDDKDEIDLDDEAEDGPHC